MNERNLQEDIDESDPHIIPTMASKARISNFGRTQNFNKTCNLSNSSFSLRHALRAANKNISLHDEFAPEEKMLKEIDTLTKQVSFSLLISRFE